MSSAAQTMDRVRIQVQQLFEYLVEYSRLKNPPKLEVSDYHWHLGLSSLPAHSCVEVFYEPDSDGGLRRLLRVRRPELSACPPPSSTLAPWLEPGWDRYDLREANLIHSLDESESADDSSPIEIPEDINLEFVEWQQQRNRWRVEEAPARKAYHLFERFFELKGTLDREGERFALTLGEGIVRWKTADGKKVDHPVLGQRCSLTFDPEVPEFSIQFSDDSLQFPTGLIRELEGIDASGLPPLLETLRTSPFDILSEEADDFLRGMARRLWSQGEYYAEVPEKVPEDRPTIRRGPVLLLTPRDRGYADAAEHFLSVLPEFELPSALLNLIGYDATPSDEACRRAQEMPLLFTKPSNREQERVARRLERNGCVLVQGPPGTGKTHTIANLIGHLLAQGKSILVTSHTSKALAVVRHQVVSQLRSLCVSVLDDGTEGQKHLEAAVKAIADKLTETTGDELELQASELERRRAQLEQQIAENQRKLLDAHRSEYEELVIGGESVTPLEAARKLREGRGVHDWIPGTVELKQVCPLRADEVEELYQLQQILRVEEERLLATDLPPSSALMDPAALASLAQREESLRQSGTQFGEEFWVQSSATLEALQLAEAAALQLQTQLAATDAWLTECRVAGSQPAEARLWSELLALIDDTVQLCAQRRSVIYEHDPQIQAMEFPLHRQVQLCQEMLSHVKAGKKFNLLGTFFKSEWKEFRKKTSVQGLVPETVPHFSALLAELELRVAREKLVLRWNRQMEGLGAPSLPKESPEREAAQLAQRIRQALSWEEKEWQPFEQQLKHLGLDWARVLAKTQPRTGSAAHLHRRQEAITQHLLRTVRERRNALELADLEKALEPTYAILQNSSSPLSESLLLHCRSRNIDYYRKGWEKLRQLEEQMHNSARRKALLDRLRAAAPGWSKAIAERMNGHEGPRVPGPVGPAWQYIQWSQQLAVRHQLDLNQLQTRACELNEQLRLLTAQYVEVLTWMFQARRTGNAQRQALNGWLESMRRIGKGTGKYAETYKAQAREKLKDCRSAVPVWIMPFSRVVESYRPGETVFDVVIVDEASQADVTGLLAFALGKEVIVVGDDQQVSPTTFEQGDRALALAQERLSGIPNWELYSGKRSVYDMAKTAFGETIRLKEHFRCVPEIIAFSNELCYDGDILPLRESDKVLVPAVVAHRVPHGKRQGRAKTNDEEAREITALIAACIEQPEYENKTFGVISLVGDDQALLIQRYLTQRLTPSVVQSRRILCGNAAQFQGDERDVMFLSLVDSPAETPGPLRLIEGRTEDRQRYNVAASRARDQMWLVHSFNPNADLKPQDLRARLLKKAEVGDPASEIKRLLPLTESVFEEQVLERLVKAGYRVIPQLPVGSYRVDMVVLGESRRVAIECDGEAYHGPNKVEEDLARQQLLERVAKLTFIRIRGSHYFRDPDAAMLKVFQSLEELGVEKLGTDSQVTQVVDSQLRETVTRRAQALLQEWFGQSGAGRDPAWEPLLQLLREWPVLQVTPYEAVEDARALNITHGTEEILVADGNSPGYARLETHAEQRFLDLVEVNLSDPQAALRELLVAFDLQDQEDSRELSAVSPAQAPVVSFSASVQPVAIVPTAQAIVSLLMRVVKADGVVLEQELAGVADFFARRFGYQDCTAEQIHHWISQYADSDAVSPEVAPALRKLSREQRELILQGAIELAWCDNEFHPNERKTIRSMGFELDLDGTTIDSLLAQNAQDQFDPLQVLGLTPLAQPADIIAAVQDLRRRYDAAQFVTHGVEFQQLAATRLAEVEKAWTLLHQQHNLESLAQPAPTVSAPKERPTLIGGSLSSKTYLCFEGYAGPDPREAPLSEVIEGLVRIVQREAPLTTSRLYDAYLEGCGIKRLGGELRKTFSRGVKAAVARGLVRLVEGDDPFSLHTVVALPAGPAAVVRQKGPRTFEQIPDTELRALGESLLAVYPPASDELFRAILDHYELKRLTANIRERLQDALAGRQRREPSSEEVD